MEFNCGQSIMHLQISGHKRVDSVNAYADLAEEESIALGRILGRPTLSNYNNAMRQSVSESTGNTNSLSGPTQGKHPVSALLLVLVEMGRHFFKIAPFNILVCEQ